MDTGGHCCLHKHTEGPEEKTATSGGKRVKRTPFFHSRGTRPLFVPQEITTYSLHLRESFAFPSKAGNVQRGSHFPETRKETPQKHNSEQAMVRRHHFKQGTSSMWQIWGEIPTMEKGSCFLWIVPKDCPYELDMNGKVRIPTEGTQSFLNLFYDY